MGRFDGLLTELDTYAYAMEVDMKRIKQNPIKRNPTIKRNPAKRETLYDWVKILVDAAHGQYVPQAFIESVDPMDWHIHQAEAEILMDPDHEFYWDTWDEVLNSAWYRDSKGKVWVLWQDGDLFAIRRDKMDQVFKEWGF